MRNSKRTMVFEISFLLLNLWVVPVWKGTAISPGKSSPAGTDLPAESRTIMGITLGRSNLTLVREKLGPAKIWTEGDAAGAEQAICYVTAEPHSVVAVFASNSEMAGPPENQLTDIRIMRGEAYAKQFKCWNVAISGGDAGTPTGLRLGISRDKVRKILGRPRYSTSSEWRYLWSIDRPLPKSDKNYHYWLSRKQECFDGKQPFFTVSSEIEVVFLDNVVIMLRFRRIESIC